MNKSLLRKVRDAIKQNPSQLNMSWYFDNSNEVGDRPAGCGTAACIAGWAFAIHNRLNPKKAEVEKDSLCSNSGLFFEELVAQNLGITDEQRCHLFEVDYWPKQFAVRYRKRRTQRGKANVAAARIDHLIKTGK